MSHVSSGTVHSFSLSQVSPHPSNLSNSTTSMPPYKLPVCYPPSHHKIFKSTDHIQAYMKLADQSLWVHMSENVTALHIQHVVYPIISFTKCLVQQSIYVYRQMLFWDSPPLIDILVRILTFFNLQTSWTFVVHIQPSVGMHSLAKIQKSPYMQKDLSIQKITTYRKLCHTSCKSNSCHVIEMELYFDVRSFIESGRNVSININGFMACSVK